MIIMNGMGKNTLMIIILLHNRVRSLIDCEIPAM